MVCNQWMKISGMNEWNISFRTIDGPKHADLIGIGNHQIQIVFSIFVRPTRLSISLKFLFLQVCSTAFAECANNTTK